MINFDFPGEEGAMSPWPSVDDQSTILVSYQAYCIFYEYDLNLQATTLLYPSIPTCLWW